MSAAAPTQKQLDEVTHPTEDLRTHLRHAACTFLIEMSATLHIGDQEWRRARLLSRCNRQDNRFLCLGPVAAPGAAQHGSIACQSVQADGDAGQEAMQVRLQAEAQQAGA